MDGKESIVFCTQRSVYHSCPESIITHAIAALVPGTVGVVHCKSYAQSTVNVETNAETLLDCYEHYVV